MPSASMYLLLPNSAILATLDPNPCSRILQLFRLQCTSCIATIQMLVSLRTLGLRGKFVEDETGTMTFKQAPITFRNVACCAQTISVTTNLHALCKILLLHMDTCTSGLATSHPALLPHLFAVQVGEPTRDAPQHIRAIFIPAQAARVSVCQLCYFHIFVYCRSKVTAVHILQHMCCLAQNANTHHRLIQAISRCQHIFSLASGIIATGRQKV